MAARCNFLPRRLAGGIPVAAGGSELPLPLRQFRRVEQHVHSRLRRSTRTRSPLRKTARPPPTAASGEAFTIDGEPDVPDCRPSPMHGSTCTPRIEQACGRAHVDDFGASRVADRSGAAHEQHAVLVDRQCGSSMRAW